MPRTETHQPAPIPNPNCQQNCHSKMAGWWIARDSTDNTVNPMELTKDSLRSRINVHPRTGCWEYTGARDAAGYGRVFVAGKETKAQRVYYEVFVGPLPKGARLKHALSMPECIGASCCNPVHHRVEQSFSEVKFARRICPKGHLIDADNAVIEQRGDNLMVRCRACRQATWRKEKRQALKRKQRTERPPTG